MGVFEWKFSERRKKFVSQYTKEENPRGGDSTGGGGSGHGENVVEFFFGWASDFEEFFAGVVGGFDWWEWEVEEGECTAKRGVDGDEEFVC
jgi:hypothetical protein